MTMGSLGPVVVVVVVVVDEVPDGPVCEDRDGLPLRRPGDGCDPPLASTVEAVAVSG